MSSRVETRLTFYGGVEGDIGGNCILIERIKESRAFGFLFDCGVKIEDYIYCDRIRCPLESIDQYVRWGIRPSSFAEDIKRTDLKACFISHAHTDHWQALPALIRSMRPYEQPVIWATNTTADLVRRKGRGGQDLSITRRVFHDDPFNNDYYQDVESGVSISLFPTDHSIAGACAFILVSNEGIVVYTGDFRDHGVLSEGLTKQFWHYAKEIVNNSKKITLICEGTNFGPPVNIDTEDDVQQKFIRYIGEAKGRLLMCVVNMDDIWRVLSLQKAVERTKSLSSENDRQIVLTPDIFNRFKYIEKNFIKDYSGVITEETIKQYLRIKSMHIFEKKLRELRQDPSKFLIVTSPYRGFSVVDEMPSYWVESGSLVLSISEHLEEIEHIPMEDYRKLMASSGLHVSPPADSSGHVIPSRLVRIIEYLTPQKIFLVHTRYPEGLRKYLSHQVPAESEIICPKLGETLDAF